MDISLFSYIPNSLCWQCKVLICDSVVRLPSDCVIFFISTGLISGSFLYCSSLVALCDLQSIAKNEAYGHLTDY